MKSTSNTHSRSAVLLLIAGLAFGFATIGGVAQAAEPQQALSIKVAYGDLNLDSVDGAKALYARLRGAAAAVCRPLEDRDLARQQARQTCFNDAVARAVAEVNKTAVTALHHQTINRSTAARAS